MLDLNLVPIGYAYDDEGQALAAAERLDADRFDPTDISVITPSMIRESRAELLDGSSDGDARTAALAVLVQSVHDASAVPDGHAAVYARNLQQGRSLVLLTPPFGRAGTAEALLEKTGSADMGELPPVQFHTWLQAAPLSALLRLPVLSHGRSRLARLFGAPLSDSDFLPGRAFGDLLSDKPTPLSSAIGMKILSDDPTPLSSAIGMKVLADERPADKQTSFGLPLLADTRPAEKTTSFGLPLLSRNNPAPLSSLLGLRVLARDQDGKARVG